MRPIPITQFQDRAAAVVSQTQTGPDKASPAAVRFWVIGRRARLFTRRSWSGW